MEHLSRTKSAPLRIVGFDVGEQKSEVGICSLNPVCVVPEKDCSSVSVLNESPRSSLAAALRTEVKPFPSLSIRTPRANGSLRSLTRCVSHNNLGDKSKAGDPESSRNGLSGTVNSPGSRSSAGSSTPIHIPSASLGRVNTCPVDLSMLHVTAALPSGTGIIQKASQVQTRHSRRPSMVSVASADSELTTVREGCSDSLILGNNVNGFRMV